MSARKSRMVEILKKHSAEILEDWLKQQRLVASSKTKSLKESEFREQSSQFLALHSDGLDTRWNLHQYPGLSVRHPSLIAGMLYRDHCRGNDDVTVLVARREEAEGHAIAR